MCFTETQSYVNTVILVVVAVIKIKSPLLSSSLAFLALKDLIQGLSYRSIRRNTSTNLLTVLSWVHISFQPLFCNLIFGMHFDPEYPHWKWIIGMCVVFAVYNLTILREFDVQGDPPCKKRGPLDDHCSPRTESYIGEFHIGYRFALDNTRFVFDVGYIVLLMAPFLTKAWKINAFWLGSVGLLRAAAMWTRVKSGEFAAIWCFLSILVGVPVALLDRHITPQ